MQMISFWACAAMSHELKRKRDNSRVVVWSYTGLTVQFDYGYHVLVE